MQELNFHDSLKQKTHNFIMQVYDVTEHFPKSELYGTTSQLRRAAVSVMLNNVEGFARNRTKVKLNFYEIAYGSAQETKYLLFLAKERKWMSGIEYLNCFKTIEEVSRMLWKTTKGLEQNIDNVS